MASADAIRLAALEVAAQMSAAEPMAHVGRIEAAIRNAVAAEREACMKIAKRERFGDCGQRGVMDPETGEVPCIAEQRGGICECVTLLEHGEHIATEISKRK